MYNSYKISSITDGITYPQLDGGSQVCVYHVAFRGTVRSRAAEERSEASSREKELDDVNGPDHPDDQCHIITVGEA